MTEEHSADYAELARIIQQSDHVVCSSSPGGRAAVVPGDALRRALADSGGAPMYFDDKPISYACGWKNGEKVGEWGEP